MQFKNKLTKVLTTAAAGLLSAVMLAGCGSAPAGGTSAPAEGTSVPAGESSATVDSSASENSSAAENPSASAAGQDNLLTGKHHVEITIKDKGIILVELDADVAPITVTNFVKLAEEGFYDGLTFHRIINGFMMQGGDPKGDGTGGSDETIKGEFSGNGVANSISHTRGTISMARSQMADSASSQFFIMHADNPGLDGDYAAFGQVTEGMEIVDDICENTTGQDRNGVVPNENRPVIESIKVID